MKLRRDKGTYFFVKGGIKNFGLYNVVLIKESEMSYDSFIFVCLFKRMGSTGGIEKMKIDYPYRFDIESCFGMLEGRPELIYRATDGEKREFQRRMFFDILYTMDVILRNWDSSVLLYH